jgi:DNA-binding IclR family transcriptional regulator
MSTTSAGPKFPRKTLARMTTQNPKKLDAQVNSARAAGFFAAFGERNSDVGSMSAPVFNYAGHLAAVLGVGFPTQRVGPDDVGRLGPAVADAARAASAALGFKEANTSLPDGVPPPAD